MEDNDAQMKPAAELDLLCLIVYLLTFPVHRVASGWQSFISLNKGIQGKDVSSG